MPNLFLSLDTLQVFSAFSYLHHNNIVHRDLKADNITVPSHDLSSLSASNVVAQVIDFGMGRCLLLEENDNDPAEIHQHELDSYENSLAVETQFDGMDMDTPEAEEPLYRRCTPSESSPLCVFFFELLAIPCN